MIDQTTTIKLSAKDATIKSAREIKGEGERGSEEDLAGVRLKGEEGAERGGIEDKMAVVRGLTLHHHRHHVHLVAVRAVKSLGERLLGIKAARSGSIDRRARVRATESLLIPSRIMFTSSRTSL